MLQVVVFSKSAWGKNLLPLPPPLPPPPPPPPLGLVRNLWHLESSRRLPELNSPPPCQKKSTKFSFTVGRNEEEEEEKKRCEIPLHPKRVT